MPPTPTPSAGVRGTTSPTIWWINGPVGVGKTTLVTSLARSRNVHIFEPEEVGLMLRRVIHEPVDDLQAWPAWRALVAETTIQLVDHYGTDRVCPVSLLDQAWAREIFVAIEPAGIPQRHIALHAEPGVLHKRITTDQLEADALEWRLEAMSRYTAARAWLADEAEQIDTTHLNAEQVLHTVEALITAT